MPDPHQRGNSSEFPLDLKEQQKLLMKAVAKIERLSDELEETQAEMKRLRKQINADKEYPSPYQHRREGTQISEVGSTPVEQPLLQRTRKIPTSLLVGILYLIGIGIGIALLMFYR